MLRQLHQANAGTKGIYMNAEGKVLKYGDNIDTDVIIPARYLAIQDKKELASHTMEDIDADFLKKLAAGDIVVAGKNFGPGSSRETAPMVIKGSGVSAYMMSRLRD